MVGDAGAVYWLVPPDLHAPIRQVAVMLRGSEQPEAARKYLEFLRSASAREILETQGYLLPPGDEAEKTRIPQAVVGVPAP